MELSSGQQIGQYVIVSKIGLGGLAIIYRAHQQSMERDVAVKVITPDETTSPNLAKRFDSEAKIIASLHHPHIVKVFDYGRFEDSFYLVMELLEGGSLTDLIRKQTVPIEKVMRVLGEIADALDYIHNKGIIHRDMKPSNVLFDENGYATLTDFGISKRVDTATGLTTTGTAVGTLMYMAPEQILGQRVDRRADVYALGVVLFEMLTGKSPFKGSTAAAISQSKINEPIPSIHRFRAYLPPDTQQVFEKALDQDPDKRFQSASELYRAFKNTTQSKPFNAPIIIPALSPAPPVADSLSVTHDDVTVPMKAIEAAQPAPRLALPVVPTVAARRGSRPMWGIGIGAAVVVILVALIALAGWIQNRAAASVATLTGAAFLLPSPTSSPGIIIFMPTEIITPSATTQPPTTTPTDRLASATPSAAPTTPAPSATALPTGTPTEVPTATPSTTAIPSNTPAPSATATTTAPPTNTATQIAAPVSRMSPESTVPTDFVALLRFATSESSRLQSGSFNCGIYQKVIDNLDAIAKQSQDEQAADARQLVQSDPAQSLISYCNKADTPADSHLLTGNADTAWTTLRTRMNAALKKYTR